MAARGEGEEYLQEGSMTGTLVEPEALGEFIDEHSRSVTVALQRRLQRSGSRQPRPRSAAFTSYAKRLNASKNINVLPTFARSNKGPPIPVQRSCSVLEKRYEPESSIPSMDDRHYLVYKESEYRKEGVKSIKAAALPLPKEFFDAHHPPFMTPHQRRLIAEVEKSHKVSLGLLRRETHEKVKQRELVRCAFPSGVEGFDSPANPNSTIYIQESKQYERQRQRAQSCTAVRQELHAKYMPSRIINCAQSAVEPEKRSTRRITHQLPEPGTFERVFQGALEAEPKQLFNAPRWRHQQKIIAQGRTVDVLGNRIPTY